MSDENKEVLENEEEVVVEETKEKKKKKKISKEAEELEKLKEEFEKYKEAHLRILAEYDNFRKRSQSEKIAVYGNAVSDTVNAILPVADNIERAISQENASADDMKKGVEMILNQFNASFEKLGITAVGEAGEAFDPELHNAVSHIENEELGENVVSSVFQKGYKLNDKVIRHAMVQVAN
ncbi:MAG: nucleotide exchange factor GrpE [Clostridia bacterium]